MWGAAFKAETDDIRESPAVDFIDDMLEAGAEVIVHDPQALLRVSERYGNRVNICSDMYEAVTDADVLALCTEWRQYRIPDVPHLKRLAKNIVAFDGRNVWDKRDFEAAGVKMFGIVRRYQPESEAALHAIKDDLDPVGVLDASDSVISSRRPTSLQNHTMDESRPSLRALSK